VEVKRKLDGAQDPTSLHDLDHHGGETREVGEPERLLLCALQVVGRVEGARSNQRTHFASGRLARV